MDSVKASVRAQRKSQIPTKVMIALFSRFAEHYRGGIVPELLQNDAQPPRITPIALKLLQNLEARKSQQEELEKVYTQLGNPGAAERTAQIILDCLH